MTYVYPLCSSSKGNATYIGDQNSGILIDAGIGIKICQKALAEKNIDLSAIKAIFITHEHTDHIKGLLNISKKLSVPVYSSKETLEEIVAKNSVFVGSSLFEIHKKSVCVDNFLIKSFDTPHDSVHSQGYKIITKENKSITICTDLGYVTETVYQNLSGSDVILLESNYDENMLFCGEYPYMLKRRIAGEKGHLSNDNCGDTLKKLISDGSEKFILGHLSENNNNPDIAYMSAIDALNCVGAKENKDYSIYIANVRTDGYMLEV